MELNIPRWLAGAGIIALAGCASTTTTTEAPESRLPEPALTAEPEPLTPLFEETSPGQEASIAFAAYRNAAMPGLYGQFVARDTDAGGQFDGSANVAQISFATEGGCFDPDIDRSGKWMVFASTMHRSTADLYLKSIPGKTVTQLTSDPADDSMPNFSPDGQRIAFASNRAGNWDIYIVSIDGGQPIQITNDPEDELHPSWSPDGSMLAYCKLGAQSGKWEIWISDITSPGVRHFLEYGMFPKWCPDVTQSKLLFQRARQRGSRFHSVWTIDYINGDAMHPTEIVAAANAAVINPGWSPDGALITFVTIVDPPLDPAAPIAESDVWMVSADGACRTNLTNGKFANFQPVWSADGRVFFVSNRSGVDNIWAVTTQRALDAMPGTSIANANRTARNRSTNAGESSAQSPTNQRPASSNLATVDPHGNQSPVGHP